MLPRPPDLLPCGAGGRTTRTATFCGGRGFGGKPLVQYCCALRQLVSIHSGQPHPLCKVCTYRLYTGQVTDGARWELVALQGLASNGPPATPQQCFGGKPGPAPQGTSNDAGAASGSLGANTSPGFWGLGCQPVLPLSSGKAECSYSACKYILLFASVHAACKCAQRKLQAATLGRYYAAKPNPPSTSAHVGVASCWWCCFP